MHSYLHTTVSSELIFVPGSPHVTHLGDLSLGAANNEAINDALSKLKQSINSQPRSGSVLFSSVQFYLDNMCRNRRLRLLMQNLLNAHLTSMKQTMLF